MSSANSRAKVGGPAEKPVSGRLFFLSASSGQVFSANPDGSDLKVIVSEGRRIPDGIVVDKEAGHLYWTNMGNPNANDGSIERADIDGGNASHIVSNGGTFTPKQLQLDRKNRKLYWSDREGMRIMRANLDGSKIETLVDTSEGDARPGKDAKKWCVGIALDVERGKVYWTQKGPEKAGQGRIFRANLEIPKGQTPANRQDIEVLYNNLPEPIDLDLDLGDIDDSSSDDNQSQGEEADGENQSEGESASAGAQASEDGSPADSADADADQEGDADAAREQRVRMQNLRFF